MSNWWTLPGPSRFLRKAARAIREGRSIVVCLPEHAPPGLRGALRLCLEQDGVSWQHIAPDGQAPAAAVFERFVPDAPVDLARNARHLARQAAMGGRVVCVDGVQNGQWPAWREFLVEYAHASRSLDLFDRAVFVMAVKGGEAAHPPDDDVALEVHAWKGVTDALDMQLYAAHLLEDVELAPPRRQLMVHLVSGLALFDPRLAERLSELTFEEMLQPLPHLRQLAAERGWSLTSQARWESGQTDLVEGAPRTHSALLALTRPEEVTHRVWKAQLAVVFPLIEETRQQILERLRPVLEVPFHTRFGEEIRDLRDLELGHILFQLERSTRRVPAALREQLKHLVDIRNALAHMQPLTPALAAHVV